MYQKYQIVELVNDITPSLTKGMQGVILKIWNDMTVEVEFLDSDGFNYEYHGQRYVHVKNK